MLNFWGPNCVPCRGEFPLFKSKLEDGDRILRSIQIGEITDAEFERRVALIIGPAPSGGTTGGGLESPVPGRSSP